MSEVITTIMEAYPQYKLEDFFQKHYYNGGLSYGQVFILYKNHIKREVDKFHFLATLHGFNLNNNECSDGEFEGGLKQPKNQSLPIFKDPSEYSHLDEKEKEKLTQKMMGHHKAWANKQL